VRCATRKRVVHTCARTRCCSVTTLGSATGCCSANASLKTPERRVTLENQVFSEPSPTRQERGTTTSQAQLVKESVSLLPIAVFRQRTHAGRASQSSIRLELFCCQRTKKRSATRTPPMIGKLNPMAIALPRVAMPILVISTTFRDEIRSIAKSKKQEAKSQKPKASSLLYWWPTCSTNNVYLNLCCSAARRFDRMLVESIYVVFPTAGNFSRAPIFPIMAVVVCILFAYCLHIVCIPCFKSR